ncbi:hypothetical protein GJ675_06590 [Hafnia alvei]|nr:hypothetical protein [Hafnia alvei]
MTRRTISLSTSEEMHGKIIDWSLTLHHHQ